MNIYTKNNIPNGFYVYFYLRKNYTPYYVGKGSGARAWVKNKTVKAPKNKSNIIIIDFNLTEIQSFILERYYIRWFGRKDIGTGILRNMTDGGEGSSGRLCKEETKKKIGESNKGKTRGKRKPENFKFTISNILKNKPKSELHKEKLRKPKTKNICRIFDKKEMAIGGFLHWERTQNLNYISPSKGKSIGKGIKKQKTVCKNCKKEFSKSGKHWMKCGTDWYIKGG
jgi:hypothetical protein